MTGWDADWVGPILAARRIVTASGPLDHGSAGRLCAELMALDGSGDEAITLRLSSSGGAAGPALAVMDTLDVLGVPVHAFCSGLVEGSAVAVLCACSKRVAAPHCRFHLCSPSSELAGPASTLSRRAQVLSAESGQLAGRIAARCKAPLEKVAADIASGSYLDAAEATGYGLLDGLAWPSHP